MARSGSPLRRISRAARRRSAPATEPASAGRAVNACRRTKMFATACMVFYSDSVERGLRLFPSGNWNILPELYVTRKRGNISRNTLAPQEGANDAHRADRAVELCGTEYSAVAVSCFESNILWHNRWQCY